MDPFEEPHLAVEEDQDHQTQRQLLNQGVLHPLRRCGGGGPFVVIGDNMGAIAAGEDCIGVLEMQSLDHRLLVDDIPLLPILLLGNQLLELLVHDRVEDSATSGKECSGDAQKYHRHIPNDAQ